MKTLNKILEGVKFDLVRGVLSASVNQIQIDSRNVQKGDCFIAIKGTASDGHNFIEKAIEAGARTIIYSDDYQNANEQLNLIQVQNTRKILGRVAANFFGNPSRKLKVWGVTGTNGKTTTSVLLFKLFRQLGYKVGLISTIDVRINDDRIPSKLTTPDALSLQGYFDQMLRNDCTHVFMEVSSHALDQGRVDEIDFDVAAFTNISHDHLDYHKDMKDYIRVKKTFFDRLKKEAQAIINLDDRNGKIMIQNCAAIHRTYALKTMADYKGKIMAESFEGLHLLVNDIEAHFRLVGTFNAYNLLNVIASCQALGLEMDEFLPALTALSSAEGRLEQVQVGNRKAFVDYAHTPDALENVLKTLNKVKAKGERIVTVVGAGGDRDKSKRPKMAAIAAQWSDLVILTSDNPRTEDPAAILKDMEAGLIGNLSTKVSTIIDRKQAIKTACMLALENDVVLVAGKGHENYQDINGVKIPFDDKEILKEILKSF